ncbi:MAG: hypothetical protein WCE94_15345 [Candidatus Methanoperedens sp.]
MMGKAKMEYGCVTTALWGRLMRKEIENDFESLASSISKQTGVAVERCKEIMHMGDAIVLAKVMKMVP